MELQFNEQHITCLQPAVREIQNLEQTQELKLSEGMPDIGRILSTWGQTVLRSKEWRDDRIAVSGGVMVWVLYAPEDGSQVRCLESWIPFQMYWDLPADTPEGKIRIQSMLRSADARSVSARKILVRCGVTAMAECYCPMEGKWYTPENMPGEVQLLRRRYPMRLPREAGEKTFTMEEEMTLPLSAPVPEKLLYETVHPTVTDCRLLGDRLLFRGNLNLHLLYVSEEGQLHSWDFELPFSQFAQLGESYSGDAQGDIRIELTNLELELLDEGQMLLKAGLTAQYLVEDMQVLELVADAYSLERPLNIRTEQLALPAVLDNRQENIYGEQKLPEDAAIVVDVCFFTGFPRQQRNADTVTLLPSGAFQVLYYAQDGSLQSANLRWEGKMDIPADEDVRILVTPLPMNPEEPASGSMTVRTQLPIRLTSMTNHGIPMVSGLEVGQQQGKKADRPSLILRRVGEEGLWPLAKSSGSTVEAIRQANHLESEPQPGQLLLIPVE